MTTDTNYWEMDDATLAESYRKHTETITVDADGMYDPGPNDDGTFAETLAFIEDAIMQRIGAPDDADPGVDPEWQAAVQGFVRGVQARADYEESLR